MYDPFAQGIIEDLPDLDGLTADDAQRALSRTYFALVNLRLRAAPEVSDRLARDVLFLRRLANTLESRAVFDIEVEPRERQASAFVAAESLSLLADLRETVGALSDNPVRIEREEVFSRVEAALLYIVAGYDANAGGVIRKIPSNSSEPSGSFYKQARFHASEWTLEVLIDLCTFHLNPLPPAICPVAFGDGIPNSLIDLEYDVRGRLYARTGEAVRAYMGWLTGEVPAGLITARSQLTRIAERLAESQYPINADVHHLARLLLAVLENTEGRSLFHAIPPPDPKNADTYQDYLRIRSKGPEGGSGRPLLWPSVQKYAEECLPGPNHHAVVSMPTGSGKSFLAELAISQVLPYGWILYLVPTNALAHQVRRDLRRGLKPLEAEVWAFIGDSEYTTLEGERVEYVPPRTIAVMTPEKCLLSTRLNPEAFNTCKLCVFDECHLIGERQRGVIAELILSQLMILAPECRFLLMSAIVQNPEDLAEWLHEATEGESLPVTLKWRPTRSLRCAAGVDLDTAEEETKAAQERLEPKAHRFKNAKFESNFALLAGLQGAWQTDNVLDYALVKMHMKALLEVHREPINGDWRWEVRGVSWVNESSRRLGQMLTEARIPTLIFLPANKHYPFSVGSKVNLSDELRAELPKPSERVRALLTLAEDELGLPSEVANLIERGVSVHTAALLETEKSASEESFCDGTTKVMLATGTLAQGLNLPAIAVVIGGTRIGYSPEESQEVVERRTLSQLINASGRAGRAGFANQGLVIAVPNSVLYLKGPDEAPRVSDEIFFLSKADAAVEIHSPLSQFMDSIVMGQFDAELASSEELVAAVILGGGGPKSPNTAEVLHRTYAAYLRRRSGLDDGAQVGAVRLAEVRTKFVAQSGAPEWLPVAAQRAGLGFFTTLRLYQAWTRIMPQLPIDVSEWNVQTWIAIFFKAVQYLTPKQVVGLFDEDTLKRFLPGMYKIASELLPGEDDNPKWMPPEQWLLDWQQVKVLTKLWVDGRPIKDIASKLLGLDADGISSQRNHGGAPIPKTLAFLNKIIDRLALLAGGLVAVVEEQLRAEAEAGDNEISQPPFELSALPLCIKYGCDAPQTLAWYRFGLRLRRSAHLLAQAFPLDPSIQDDSKLFEQVHLLRSQWLNGLASVPQPLLSEHTELFDAIRVVLSSQYG